MHPAIFFGKNRRKSGGASPRENMRARAAEPFRTVLNRSVGPRRQQNCSQNSYTPRCKFLGHGELRTTGVFISLWRAATPNSNLTFKISRRTARKEMRPCPKHILAPILRERPRKGPPFQPTTYLILRLWLLMLQGRC